MNDWEEQLKHAVQALAQPAEVQAGLFPSFVVAADELALEFERTYMGAEAAIGAQWSSVQADCLRKLDQEIERLSGEAFPEIWLAPDALSHPAWATFRAHARDVMVAFSWPFEAPSKTAGIYVGRSNG